MVVKNETGMGRNEVQMRRPPATDNSLIVNACLSHGVRLANPGNLLVETGIAGHAEVARGGVKVLGFEEDGID